MMNKTEELINRGTSLDSLGKPNEALQFYAEAERLIKGPASTHLQYGVVHNRAIALEHAGRFDEALREWDRAMKLFLQIAKSGERFHGSERVSKASLLVEKAKTLGRMGRASDAIRLCQEALSLEPDLYDAISTLALSFGFAERWDEAIRWNDRALAIQPKDPVALSNRAWALSGLKRYPEAIEWYDQALAVSPAHPEALYGKGTAFLYQERLDQAEFWLRKATDVKPSYSEAWNHLGIALLKAKKPGAEECFEKAIQANPGNTVAQANLAEANSRSFVQVILETVRAGGGTIMVPPSTLTDQFFGSLDRYLDWFRTGTGTELFFIRRLAPSLRQVRTQRTRSIVVVVTVDSPSGGMLVDARVGYEPETGR